MQVDYMGLKLKNPVIAASGPWCRGADGLQKAIDAGVGAVVTETISLNPSREITPRVYERGGGVLNTTLYSPLSLEQWTEELNRVEKRDSRIIGNIRGTTPSEFAYIASRLERQDVDAIELSPFTPTGAHLNQVDEGMDALLEVLEAVADAVSIPISVRLPPHFAVRRDYIRALEKGGVKALSAVESPLALWGVDLQSRKSVVPTFGGYTGEHIRPITFGAVATLAQMTGCSIAAMGGISRAENVLEVIMLGASAAQVGSAILFHGYKHLSEMIRGIEKWLSENGTTCDQIRGAALSSLATYEDVPKRERKIFVRFDAVYSQETANMLVRSCLTEAIQLRKTGGIKLDQARCNGCGLCLSLAPGVMDIC